MRCLLHVVVASALLSLGLGAGPVAAGQSTPAGIKTEIERKASDLKLGKRVVVTSVADGVVSLEGEVPTLYDKYQVIEFARKLDGVKEVRSTITIAKGETDNQLAQNVGKAIRGYSSFTAFDYVDGVVRNGVVTLSGALATVNNTNADKKHAEIVERIQKIRGVLDLKDQIKIAEVVPSDDVIRQTLFDRIYSDDIFRQYSLNNPPIHLIVDHGHVTLIGIVASQLERQKAYEIARSVGGVFSVDNKVLLAKDVK